METSLVVLLFVPILLANTLTASILRNGANPGEVACDPAANPSDCPSNRRCEDMDGDGQSTCVCDSRFYKTNAAGNCVLGLKELIYEMEKEIETLKANVSDNANDIASNEAQISMNAANITAADDQVNMEAMDEMKDKLDALNQSLSGDLDQAMMDLEELELKQQEDINWLNDTMNELLMLPTTTKEPFRRCVPPECTTLIIWGGDKRNQHQDKDAMFVNFEDMSSCIIPSFGIPYTDYSITGGLLDNGKMVQCRDAECYGIVPDSDGNPEVIVNMSRQRKYAATLQLSDGRLWITGGTCSSGCSTNDADGETYHAGVQVGSEYLTSEGSTPGPLLPVGASSHCIEYMDETHIILFGGDHKSGPGSSADNHKTYIFDTETETWSDGPVMPSSFSYIQGDYHGMCASLANGLVFGQRSGTSERTTLTADGQWKRPSPNFHGVYIIPKIAYDDNTLLTVGGVGNRHIRKTTCQPDGSCENWEVIKDMGREIAGSLLAWVHNSTIPDSCVPFP